MTEKQSSKTVSIRTKGDAEELFKTIAKDFDSQDEAFRSLLAAYNREHKKDDLSEHRDKIESFTANLKSAEKSFLDILESYKEAKDKAKADFIDEIESLKKSLEGKESEILSSKKALEGKDKELNQKLLENKENKDM